MFIVFFIIFFIAFLLLLYVTSRVSCPFFIRNLCANRSAKNSIAITFDDGVDAFYTPKVLNLLDSYGAKGTFFVVGEKAEKNPEILKDIIARGNEIGNHSYRHKASFSCQSSKKILEEIDTTTKLLEEITSVKIKLFRSPFGVSNPMIAKALKRTNLTPIAWSLRSLDTIYSAETVKKKLQKKLRAGDVVLLHDNRENILEILEFLLELAKERKLKCKSVSELFKLTDK